MFIDLKGMYLQNFKKIIIFQVPVIFCNAGTAKNCPYFGNELKRSAGMCRAVDLRSFFADPDLDPAVFLNADLDPDPAALKMRIRIQLKKFFQNTLMQSFL